ncbi:endocuticle structural glycoprotein ABD-5-like [Trichoplusia ni]|uniref:Endocuticle structural glycoprotein ABD-5-like n=1 Tax=Trichoplusia ni TaxID=7111 RepID=A0A7E5VP64_TRINI|nr:endocuticle structural glycoprotein ABD-5-like [Trichoplusia ni]
MKLLVVCALFAVVAAAPQDAQDVQILRYDADNDGLGNYNFVYEQSDGSKRNENGELRNAGAEDEFLVMRGSYSWVGPDGVTYTVNYVADDQGFQPTIEQGPGGAVPAAVVASLLG